jgi:serine/threonine protein kinase
MMKLPEDRIIYDNNYRKIELLEELGRGKNGVVLKGRYVKPRPDEPEFVAVKALLNPDSGLAWLKLINEAKALANLKTIRNQHPNILKLYDLFRYPAEDVENSTIYMVMEYCSLKNLEEYPNLTRDEALLYLVQICEGMAYVHKRGLGHHDLAPQNILVGRDEKAIPVLKIADFGQASVPAYLGGDGLNLHGKIEYSAPEVLKKESFGLAADVFSIGAIAYKLLTRRFYLDFRKDERHYNYNLAISRPQPIVPPHEVIKDIHNPIPLNLSKVIMKALSFKPENRYPAAGELLEALRDILIYNPPLAESDAVEPKQIITPVINLNPPAINVVMPGQHQRSCPIPPPAPDHFGGRDEELIELKTRIRDEQAVALTAVRGLGGIGKTTIAKQIAHYLFYNPAEKIFKAVLWKRIKRNPDPLQLLLDWAYLAGPAFIYKNQPVEQLVYQVKALLENLIKNACEECEPNRVLVVFDDVWDDGIAAVRLLRQACPGKATVLITTRTGWVAAKLSAFEFSLDKLEPVRGVEFLKKYLPGANPAALFELATVLGGHALAMTIAARRVLKEARQKQAKALLTHIEQYRQGLPSGTPFSTLELELGEDKEDNLTLALYYSYEELNTQEQKLFRALGLDVIPYNAAFDEELLGDIWGIEQGQVRKNCERLRLLSLIDVDETSEQLYEGNWYRQHPLVQSYARALLNQAG